MALEQNPDWQLIQFMIAPTAVFNPFHYRGPDRSTSTSSEIQYGDEATQAAVAKELNTYIVEQAWFAPFYRVQGSFATDANTTAEMLPTNAYPRDLRLRAQAAESTPGPSRSSGRAGPARASRIPLPTGAEPCSHSSCAACCPASSCRS